MGLPYEREAQIGHTKITQSIEEKIEQKEVTHLIEQITLHGYQTQKTNEILEMKTLFFKLKTE